MCAKHYENPTMLSKVTAKNVGDVFLRHTVLHSLCTSHLALSLLFSLQATLNDFEDTVLITKFMNFSLKTSQIK